MPLKPQIEHKAVIAFLSKLDNERETIEDIVRESYPQDYDMESIDSEKFVSNKYDDSIVKLYRGVSSRLFGIYNGRIVLRERELTKYNLYYTAIDVYPFFAYKLLDISKELSDGQQRLEYLLRHLDESFVFSGNLEEKLDTISDIHIHIGASIDFHYRISDLLKDPYKYANLETNDIAQDHMLSKDFAIYGQRLYLITHIIESSILDYYTKKEGISSESLEILNYFFDSNNSKSSLDMKLFEKKEEILSESLEILNYFFDSNNSKSSLDMKLFEKYESIKSIRTSSHLKEHLFNIEDMVERGLLRSSIEYFSSDNPKRDTKKADKLLLLYMTKRLILEVDEDKNSLVSQAIKSYLILRNKIKQRIYQQHRRSGFGYFSSYSKNSIKKATKGELKSIFQTAFHPELSTNIEYRSSIMSDTQQMHKFFEKLHKTIGEINNEKRADVKYQIKIIFHFIKRDNHLKDTVRYEEARKTYQEKSYVLHQLLTKSQIRYLKLERDDHKNEIEDLAYNYFHGIDAASNETDVAPEAFAPVYRYFKNSVISSGLAIPNDMCYEEPKNINLQYTFHVGEEFRDIISGIRAIYESIIFLDLKDEDRLGHAIALGIDPNIVLGERQHITLSKGEYMDNLIFLYYIFSMVDHPPYSLEEIRSIIEQIGNDIYGKVSDSIGRSFTVDDYIASWLLRRNCPLKVKQIIDILDDSLQKWADDKKYLKQGAKNQKCINYEKAWYLKKYMECEENDKENKKRLHTIGMDTFERAYIKASIPDFICKEDIDSVPLKRYLSIRNSQKAYMLYWAYANKNIEESIYKKYNEFYDASVIFPTDVYEYLQDYVMEKVVTKRDIVIEILPTSNLLISSLNSMDKHPFLRFHPPLEVEPNRFGIRTKKIKIALGTDDPGIQGTSLMMEYHILYDIVSRKYSKEIAHKYLLNLVDFGNYIFEKGRKR